MKSKIKKTILYSSYLLLVIFFSLEIILRFYNPFHFRLKYDEIILPANQKMVIKNTINEKLDKKIINTKNSLGFRGPEKPADFENALSIITVGGSATSCYFLSDGKSWPEKLSEELKPAFKNLWLNNAGIDGHSTFGHQVLLNDYLINLKPKVILFLTGINDVGNEQPTFHDKLNMKGAYSDFKHFIFTNSEVLSLGLNLIRGWKAQRMNNTTHKLINLKTYETLNLDDQAIQKRLDAQGNYLINYKRRIEQLIDTCLAYDIQPVFITQPNLLGEGKDSITGADLKKIKLGADLNGNLMWNILEKYNTATIETCAIKNIPVIDLAHLLPKSSLFFYDMTHFTNQGAEKVALLLKPELENILKNKFPSFYIKTL